MALTTAADVGTMLRHQQGETVAHQAVLEQYVNGVSEYLQKPERYGPLEATTGSHVADGGETVVLPLFPNRPFVVTGVTVDGDAFTDYTHDEAAGILYGPFADGRSNVTVSYTVGFAEDAIPTDVQQAATMMCVHLWNVWSQRGQGYSEGLYPIGFAEPAATTEYLSAYKSRGGFA